MRVGYKGEIMPEELRIELFCCTQTLMQEINNKQFKQADVALTYAMAVCSSDKTDWHKVNKAIMERWSISGLKRVKDMAWKRIEQKGKTQ